MGQAHLLSTAVEHMLVSPLNELHHLYRQFRGIGLVVGYALETIYAFF